jgi:hypothetical protein
MLHLQKRYDPRGFKIYPKKEGDVTKTDDIIDALCGSVYQNLLQGVQSLPKGKLVNMNISSDVQWRTMQGGSYSKGDYNKMDRIRSDGNIK